MSGARPCAVAIVLACAIGGGCVRRETSLQPAGVTITQPSESVASSVARRLWAPPPRRQPKNDRERVFYAAFYAKEKSKEDPDAALADLKSALGRWPEYDADIHFVMAMAFDRKMFRAAQASDERRGFARRKLDHLEKALECIEAGGQWACDPLQARTRNLEVCIEQARRAVERLSPGPTQGVGPASGAGSPSPTRPAVARPADEP